MAILIVIFCTGLLLNIYIHMSYSAYMPRTPDPTTGRTARISVNHGSLVYLTPQEFKRAKWILGVGFQITFVVGVLMALVRIYWEESP
jgi:hypothetical protein